MTNVCLNIGHIHSISINHENHNIVIVCNCDLSWDEQGMSICTHAVHGSPSTADAYDIDAIIADISDMNNLFSELSQSIN